jgi:multi-sensor signal transduction histidine kinase
MDNNHNFSPKDEVFIKIALGVSIALSEIIIIFITSSVQINEFISILFAIFALNLAFIIFGIRQRQIQAKMFKTHKKSEDTQNRLLTIINSLTDAVLSVDSRGRVELYNSATLDLLDEDKQIVGKNLSKICKLSKINTETFDMQEIFRIGKPYFSTNDLILSKDDEKLRIEIEIIRIRESSGKKNRERSKKFVVILRDITKQKTLDEERDEFISVVSHELRTPVAILEGSLSNLRLLIQKKAPSKLLETTAETAYKQNTFLATMVNDLSALSKVERGINHQTEIIHPQELAESLFNKYHKSAAEKGLSLNLNLDNKLNSVKTSKLYLEELLQNFITNSLKYTREGSVEICFRNSPKGVIFEIKDTGIGISSSDQKRIFEKFYRSEDWRTRETGGTGLGLYVSSKLAAKIGTKIQVESKLNHGSRFFFELPKASK